MQVSFVYILQCSDGSFYTGVTANIDSRLEDHQSARDPESYTAKRLPVKLVFYAEFTDITIAIAKEKQIKNWGRAKKEALIAGKFEDLPNLSKKKF